MPGSRPAASRATAAALARLAGVATSKRNSGKTAREIEWETRQLQLVDRILGLEAEVARLRAASSAPLGVRDEIERLKAELRAAESSPFRSFNAATMRFIRARRRKGRG